MADGWAGVSDMASPMSDKWMEGKEKEPVDKG